MMLRPYNEYKTCSISWLPSIPSHWQDVMLFQCAGEQKTSNRNVHHQNLLSLSYGNVISKDINTTSGLLPASFDSYQVVSEGNIILRLTDLQNDKKSLRTGLVHETGIITSAYTCLRPRDNVIPAYLQYFLHAHDVHKVFYSMGAGVRQSIGFSEIRTIRIALPLQEEQNQIVSFIKWKSAQTSHFIAEKKREIAELTDLKNALIFHATTAGLSIKAIKHSRLISWIDTIPSHWDEIMLFQCAAEQSVSNRTVHHQNLLSLSYGKIIKKDINTSAGLLPSSFDTYQIVHDGNVILRLTDLQNDHKSFRVGLSTQTGIITSAYTCLKARDNILPEYLYYLLHAYDVSKVFYGMGGGVRQSIGYADIRRMVIPLPPLDEQQVIVDYCRDEQAKIEQMIAGIKDEITLVQELRTKTISDVATGKVDVHDIEIPQYEPEADDTVDEEEETDEDSVEDGDDAVDEEVE